MIQLLELSVVKHNNLCKQTIPKVRFAARDDSLKDSRTYFSPVASQVAVRIILYQVLKWKLLSITQLDFSKALIYAVSSNPHLSSCTRDTTKG